MMITHNIQFSILKKKTNLKILDLQPGDFFLRAGWLVGCFWV